MAKKAKSQKNPDEEEIVENGDEEEADEQPEPAEAPEEAPAPEEVPDEGAENEEPAREPVNPPAGSRKITITIDGEGTTPIIGVDGAVRTVERGVPVEVSDEEAAYLKVADLPFKTGNKKT